MKHISKYRNTFLTLVILIIISVIFVFAQNQSQQEFYEISKDVRVENKTKSLIVESLTEIRKQNSQKTSEDYRTFEVKIKNNSEKPIASFTLVTRDNATKRNNRSAIVREAIMGNWFLLPNETDINRFSAEPKGEVVLIVAAVLFNDGTQEGDATEILRLQENRAGMKLAYQQIAQVIRGQLNQTEGIDSKMLEVEISSISDEEVPMNQKSGFSRAKSFFITELKDIKENLNSESNSIFGSESKTNLAYKSKMTEQLGRIEEAITHF